MKYFVLAVLMSFFSVTAISEEKTDLSQYEPAKLEVVKNVVFSAQGVFLKTADKINLELFRVWNIDTVAFKNAVIGQSFYAPQWDSFVNVSYKLEDETNEVCQRASAYVRHEPVAAQQIDATVHICPNFFEGSTYEKIETILHETVHVLVGVGECRAMAYSYILMLQGFGMAYFPDNYWNSQNCETSEYNIFK